MVGQWQGGVAAGCGGGARSVGEGGGVGALRARALRGLPGGGGVVPVPRPAEEGARVVAVRAGARPAVSGEGGMVSVPLPAEEVARLLEPYGGRISIAAL
ncbi:hypothetical protein VM98_38730, partial [Streptomyces rubellomurinus subsp. indigoferus]